MAPRGRNQLLPEPPPPQTAGPAGNRARSRCGPNRLVPQAGRKCLELLNPAIGAAVAGLDAADRLLIKLLLLDEVPQQQVARALASTRAT